MVESKAEPRVSVIVRTKDRPDMLRRALRSITTQDVEAWEAIIVNDGGDVEVLDGVVNEFVDVAAGRIQVLHHESSLGRWPSANAGVRNTSAPLIVLHDDDDTWHREFLGRMLQYLDDNPDEWGVIARTAVIHEQYKEDGSLHETWRYVLEDHHERVLAYDILKFNRFVPIGFVYRRALHERVGLYDETLPAAADWAFNMKALAVRPINYVSDDVLAYWHQRPGIEGIAGNSVFAATGDHRQAQRAHRDNELRSYIASAGWGLPLYISSLAEDRKRETSEIREDLAKVHTEVQAASTDLQARLDRADAAIARLEHHLERSMDTRIRGFVWRQKQRIRRRFGR